MGVKFSTNILKGQSALNQNRGAIKYKPIRSLEKFTENEYFEDTILF